MKTLCFNLISVVLLATAGPTFSIDTPKTNPTDEHSTLFLNAFSMPTPGWVLQTDQPEKEISFVVAIKGIGSRKFKPKFSVWLHNQKITDGWAITTTPIEGDDQFLVFTGTDIPPKETFTFDLEVVAFGPKEKQHYSFKILYQIKPPPKETSTEPN